MAVARPDTVVRAVYEFAARRPDVLHYVPCFCGCEQGGHVGDDDCFVDAEQGGQAHGLGTPQHGLSGLPGCRA